MADIKTNAPPRAEHPRPNFLRTDWINLNGTWEYLIDNNKIGRESGYEKRTSLGEGRITVPFCPESDLSGVGHTDFINAIWYRRTLTIPKKWADRRVLLHFDAVDYAATAYVNGVRVGAHKGGYTPFTCDITAALSESGENNLVLYAEDDVRAGTQPSGKQCDRLVYYGCMYKRTTGIWQTVWAEAVPDTYIKNVKITPEPATCSATVAVTLDGQWSGKPLSLVATYNGKEVGAVKISKTVSNPTVVTLPLSEKHIWEVGHGRLYDLEVRAGKDTVSTYFGLRSVAMEGGKFLLNGKSVFGRWVLDQGFYPDGIYTARDDEALKADIIYAMQAGFNGARLHQKIFEPRFLYHADKLGYLCWGEHANWGLNISRPEAVANFLPEWLESIERDYSHPCIIGWCPFNETHDRQVDSVLSLVNIATKAADPTRPVIDTSGYYHVNPEWYDIHDYEQNVEKFSANWGVGGKYPSPWSRRKTAWKPGTPIFISEFGGIRRDTDAAVEWGTENWGYGESPKNAEEYLARYDGLVTALLDNPDICSFCYTQLYDVQQELNGLLTYDRKWKFPPETFHKINTKKAAIED